MMTNNYKMMTLKIKVEIKHFNYKTKKVMIINKN